MDKIFTILFVFSAIFFLYNKIRGWRTPNDTLEKRLYQTKSTLSLGTFIAVCGLSLIVTPRGTVDWTVGGIFLLIGLFNIIYGYRAYRHYALQVK